VFDARHGFPPSLRSVATMPTITLLAHLQPLQAPNGLAAATCPTGLPGIQPQLHVAPCRVLFVNTRRPRTLHRCTTLPLAVTITGKRPPHPATGEPPHLPHSPPPPHVSSQRDPSLPQRCPILPLQPRATFFAGAGHWPRINIIIALFRLQASIQRHRGRRHVFLPPSTTWLIGALKDCH